MFIWFRGELRTKIGDVEIDKNFIVVATYFGLAVPNRYELKNIDYFNISVVYSKGGSYEFIILSQNNKSVIFISQYYHKNYFEMKNILRKKIKYKGYKKFNTVEYFKELIF